MKAFIALLLLTTMPGWCQSPVENTVQGPVLEAYQLWSDGQAKATIAMLEPLLAPDRHELHGINLGVAWDLLASSYQDLENYDRARQAYQKAIETLRPIAAAKTQYAAVMDNFATMEEFVGHTDSANMLCEKAVRLYEELGDPVGLVAAYTNLAELEYAQNNNSAARHALQKAFVASAAEDRSHADDENVATMYSVKAALALRAGQAEKALSAIQVAIDAWTHKHGPDFYMLGTAYLLRARVLAKTGQYQQALADAQHGRAIAEAAIGKQSTAYLTAEGVYGEILKASGDKVEGARVQNEARRALTDLQVRQCYRCTIDASGFR